MKPEKSPARKREHHASQLPLVIWKQPNCRSSSKIYARKKKDAVFSLHFPGVPKILVKSPSTTSCETWGTLSPVWKTSIKWSHWRWNVFVDFLFKSFYQQLDISVFGNNMKNDILLAFPAAISWIPSGSMKLRRRSHLRSPVDSQTYSAPLSPHLMAAGSCDVLGIKIPNGFLFPLTIFNAEMIRSDTF